MSKAALGIKETVSDVNKAVMAQISDLNIQLNSSIDTKFNEISTAFKMHIDDMKKTVTSQHVGDDVVAHSSEFGSSIADQISELKIAKRELHDCLSQIRSNV